ncbi:MAG: hypothetical protein WC476_01090 [Phycisphaerae bacterium]|jgi:hypothetical protein
MTPLEAVVTVLATLIPGLITIIILLIRQRSSRRKDLNENWIPKSVYDIEVERGKEILKLYLDFLSCFDDWCLSTTKEFEKLDKHLLESGGVTAQNLVLLTQSLTALKETMERLILRLVNGRKD